MAKNVFFLGLIIAASGLVNPPIALALGLAYGFTFLHPYHVDSRKLSKFLLQISVVGLGFGMNLAASAAGWAIWFYLYGHEYFGCDVDRSGAWDDS